MCLDEINIKIGRWSHAVDRTQPQKRRPKEKTEKEFFLSFWLYSSWDIGLFLLDLDLDLGSGWSCTSGCLGFLNLDCRSWAWNPRIYLSHKPFIIVNPSISVWLLFVLFLWKTTPQNKGVHQEQDGDCITEMGHWVLRSTKIPAWWNPTSHLSEGHQVQNDECLQSHVGSALLGLENGKKLFGNDSQLRFISSVASPNGPTRYEKWREEVEDLKTAI